MLVSLRYIYQKVMGKSLLLHYVMEDAEDAQFNAVMDVFGDCHVEYLMCFWHMLKKLYEQGKHMTPAKLLMVAADVYDMHYATSDSQLHTQKTMAIRRWMPDPDVAEFGKCFYRQWLTGLFFEIAVFSNTTSFCFNE
ncbi:hypothetical protein PR003_g7043 [Phytophthora rubi]|uniref:MULE transposase domain-containing protein n=1 Tax=Phytophthora rubi TaxID=129364 RepID=A0A6A4FN27_9STRA|nr:hypothetical protein PR002_g24097 [Phytophthora rubi]KAE9049463.1 hypothetical protein PR001_g3288 [Phytophthora rubi]KAE9347197.1 hypothetical protein PR003_g7043 [Phytophthora rubi]